MEPMREQKYIDILNSELVPALGCTEPIAIAYASARARQVLGNFPDKYRYMLQRQYYKKRKRRKGTQIPEE